MYKTPKNYRIVFMYFQETFKALEKSAIDNNMVDNVYYTLKKFLDIAFEKCSVNEDYCNGWLLWFKGKRSTIFLRGLLLEVSCDYWHSLCYSNSIDRLDSLQSNIVFKLK